jgi:hypothetical protein
MLDLVFYTKWRKEKPRKMKSKKFTLVMLAVLLMGMFMLTLRIQLVRAQPSPDVNGDGKVDIADVAIGASAI